MKCMSGMATTEYLIVVSALLLAILAPLSDGQNAIEMVMDSLKSLYAGWVYMMSTAIYS